MTCTTHHNACDCREAHFATIALERDFLTKFTILLGLVLLFALARGMGWIGE